MPCELTRQDTRSIALTRTFAERHGIETGTRIRLSTPSGIEQLTIRGLLGPEGLARAFGGALAVMDLPAAQILLGKRDRIDQIDLLLRPEADVNAVRRRLESRLPSELSVTRPAQRGAHYERIVASFQAMLLGISTLCLIAGVFIIYNTTSTQAAERATVLAGLRVIEADESVIFRLLMVEATLLGTIGAVVGAAFGALLARGLSSTVTDSMGVIFQLNRPGFPGGSIT